MKYRKRWVLWILFFILLVITISILNRQTHFVPLWLGIDKYFMGCGDFWQYISETNDYLKEWIKLIDTMEVGKEPLLFLITSSFGRIAWLWGKASFIIIFFGVIKSLIVFVSYTIMFRRKQTRLLSMVFGIILWLTVVDSRNGFWRQALANMYIILFILWTLIPKNINFKMGFVISIFLSCCFLSHKIAFLYTGLILLYLTIKFLIRKNWIELKKISLILIWAVILGIPFLYVMTGSFFWYMTNYIEKYIKINNGTQEVLNPGSTDISQGVSLVPWSGFHPIIDYIIFQWFLCIIVLVNFKKMLKRTPNTYEEIILIFLLLTVVHTSFAISFSNRMVLLLNLLFAIEIGINGVPFQNKWIKIFTISSVFFLCAYASFGISFEINTTKKLARQIENDPSVTFFKENISPRNSFIISDQCWSAFAEEMYYKSFINYLNMTYWNEQEFKRSWKSSFGEFYWQVAIFMESVFQKNFAPASFKGKELYIIFWPRFVNKYNQLVRKKDPYFYNSKNVDLIYSNSDQNVLINYIFRIKNENLVYFDEINYLDRTLGNGLRR